MDQAAARGEPDRTVTRAARDPEAVGPDPAIIDPAEHNIVFTSLVTGDKDIVGLVAYSIYKQNKYDWLQAYGRLQGRMPDAVEAQSYLLGESTPRRLATYRHLAEAVLDGRGPDVPGAADGAPGRTPAPGRAALAGIAPPRGEAGSSSAALPGRATRVRPSFQLSARAIVGLCIALGVLLVLFWVLHSGAPLPPPTPAR